MVVKQLSEKQTGGDFGTPVDLGAKAENVTLSDGTSAQQKFNEIDETIGDFNRESKTDIATNLSTIESNISGINEKIGEFTVGDKGTIAQQLDILNKKTILVRSISEETEATEDFSTSVNITLSSDISDYNYLIIYSKYNTKNMLNVIVPISLSDSAHVSVKDLNFEESKVNEVHYDVSFTSGTTMNISNFYSVEYASASLSIVAGLNDQTYKILNIYAIK